MLAADVWHAMLTAQKSIAFHEQCHYACLTGYGGDNDFLHGQSYTYGTPPIQKGEPYHGVGYCWAAILYINKECSSLYLTWACYGSIL